MMLRSQCPRGATARLSHFKRLRLPEDAAGPTGLVRGPWESSLAELCAKIICRYADRENRLTIPVVYRRLPGQQGHALEAPPLEQSLLERLRL